jgi:C_GCAxxG_C_C family probable redox protein
LSYTFAVILRLDRRIHGKLKPTRRVGHPAGLDKQTALKISCPFGGGMALMGNTCGAVTGALMVISLKHGKARQGDDDAKVKTYALTREFVKRFKAKHGTITCRELLGCDIGTEEGKRFFDEHKYEEKLCAKFVADAALILEEIL